MKKENLEKYLISFLIAYIISYFLLKKLDIIRIFAFTFIYSVILYYLYLLIKYIKKVNFKTKEVNNMDENYYNDLLKEKGISELFYVLNGIDVTTMIYNKIYEMEKEKIIEISDNEINLLNENLSEEEKLIIDSIKKSNPHMNREYLGIIQKKLYDDKIIQKSFFFKDVNSKLNNILIFLYLISAYYLYNTGIFSYSLLEEISYSLGLITPIILIITYLKVVGEIRKKYGGYELTSEGIKIYKELKELKNYILKNENKYSYKYKLIFKIKDKEINLNKFSNLFTK